MLLLFFHWWSWTTSVCWTESFLKVLILFLFWKFSYIFQVFTLFSVHICNVTFELGIWCTVLESRKTKRQLSFGEAGRGKLSAMYMFLLFKMTLALRPFHLSVRVHSQGSDFACRFMMYGSAEKSLQLIRPVCVPWQVL